MNKSNKGFKKCSSKKFKIYSTECTDEFDELSDENEDENKGKDEENDLFSLSLHSINNILYRVLKISEKPCILCNVPSTGCTKLPCLKF